MVVVTCNAQGRSSGEVTADALKIAKQIAFPPGYGIELAGDAHDQQEVFGNLIVALFSGIALMYLVLVIQFGSFTAPVPVMISLPLSLIGVVLALALTHGTMNMMSIIGVIMLMGLVAKNAILLLDAARAEEREGHDREDALMHAGRKRLRPIMMTTFALIAGMLPVAIGVGEGGEFYRPMAVTIIGGTITSTLLTLLVIPCFYDSIEGMRLHLREKYRRREARWSSLPALGLCVLEFLAFLTTLRFFWRLARHLAGKPTGGLWRRDAPVAEAARLAPVAS
jgi:hydrophobic/amphiphilic exporter-1 (mainly G- bacteria), HAE1 family